ncbi:WD repeat-containing protein [Ceratobasidium sp. AG-Ba]|nr:WD repeat-containing protein [Ceratobasidium sp. AG-Ba]
MARKRDRFKGFLRDLFNEGSSEQGTPPPSRPITPSRAAPGVAPRIGQSGAPIVPLSSAPNHSNATLALPAPNPEPTIIQNASQQTNIPISENTKTENWSGLKLFARVLNKTPKAFGPLKHAVDVLVSFIDIYEATAGNQTEFQELRKRLDGLFNDLQQLLDKPAPPAITSSMKNLEKGIEEEAELIEQMQGRNRVNSYLSAKEDVDEILKCYRRIEGLFQRLTLNANIETWRTLDDLATETYLRGLPNSPAAYYGSAESIKLNRGGCTQDTRVDVLRELQEWTGGESMERIYWLNGMAGTGKTTISYSLCKLLEKNHVLGASFFCSRQLPDCRDVNRIIPTIAYQLARFSTPFFHVVSPILKENPDVYNKRIPDQFERLIVQPVNEVKDALPTNLVIVIDALDECDANTGVADILDVLLARAPGLPLRFFVSSRPDTNILDRMRLKQGDQVNTEMRLHELGRTVVQADIRTYLNDALNPRLNLSDEELGALVMKSGALFIYAATAVRYITGDNFARSTKRLKEVLGTSGDSRGGSTKEIDKLYSAILEAAFDDDALSVSDQHEMRKIIHTVICAQEPLSVDIMAGLLELDSAESVGAALRPLFSVLNTSSGGVITTLHESFRDFLLNRSRSGDFFCDSGVHHAQLSLCCFRQISIPRPFNICGLESSYILDKNVVDLKQRVDKKISGALFYACRYWGAHIGLAREGQGLADQLLQFLSERLLLWIEILNLKESFADGIIVLHQLNRWLKRATWIQSEIKGLAEDAWMFMNHCWSSPVLHSTPHLYVSALVFWRTESAIKKHYQVEESSVIGHQSTAMRMRKKTPLVTMRTSNTIGCVAYSPRDECVAVGLSNGTLKVWDAFTGQQVGQPLKGHTDSVTSVAYSPDGAYIVSGSNDNTVRIWSAQTSKQAGKPLEGHTSRVRSVAYSPDGAYIVSGSDDETVRIWSAQTGEQAGKPLEGHTGLVTSVAYSPDGAYIVSGSDDFTVRIWSAQTGEQAGKPLGGHYNLVTSVAYSPDGAYIVSGSDDFTVRIWSAQTSKQAGKPLKGHTDGVTSVAYSPDGAYIVSGSYDNIVRIWSAHTGEQAGKPLEGHTDSVTSVAYSPDGAYIVSGSDDSTVRIWSAQTGEQAGKPLEGHTDWVTSVAYSPDGAYIVSGSEDTTVRIWNTRTGKQAGKPLEGHTEWVSSITYSPDGAYIVSGSDDETVRIWDARTGQQVGQPLKGHTDSVTSVAYSPDGAYIVSGSDDNTVRIWSAQTSKQAGKPLEGHTNSVTSVAFSPDGTYIVSGSHDNTVRIWSAQTGEQAGKLLMGHTDSVRSVAYSPDGAYIVSGSEDKTVRIWSAHTGEQAGRPLEGHTDSVTSVAYSPDGAYIVSGSDDKTVRIWSAHTGEQAGKPLEGHTDSVRSVAYSPDGAYIVSGSDDMTARIWHLPSPQAIGQFCTSSPAQLSSGTFLTANQSTLIHSNSSHAHMCASDCKLDGSHRCWRVDDEGWAVLPTGELLFWIPPDLRIPLLSPQNSAIASSPNGVLYIQPDPRIIGDNWAEHFNPCK